MITAASLPDLGLYPDRFRMFCALSARVERLYLLTAGAPEPLLAEAARWPRLQVRLLGPRGYRHHAHAVLDALERGHGLDVVHDTFGMLLPYFHARSRARRRRVRLVTTLYSSVAGWYRRVRPTALMPGLKYASMRLLGLHQERGLCRVADRILVLGPGHERDLIDGHSAPADRIEWIPSEVDVDYFTPAARPRGESPLVLFAGAVFRNKGVDVLLRAAADCRDRWPALRVALVGRRPDFERPWVDAAIADAGMAEAVTLTGPVPREALREWYRRADLFAHPSLFEGSPRSVREALACGCRALVSDIPGHRGIDPEGAFMEFAPTGEAAAWSAGLAALLGEPPAAATRRAAAGVAHMRRCHTPAAVAARVAEVYHRLVREPPRG